MLILKHIARYLRSVINELLIIFLFIFLINNYFRNENVTIKSDAIGYYDYLPSLFIHKDLVRKDVPFSQNQGIYNRINTIDLYLDYKDYKVNKCHCGTAVLQMPFFLGAMLQTGRDGSFSDGYQRSFQIAIFHAAIFYLFLGIFFLKKILELYNIKKYLIILLQLLMVFGTTVTNYANFDAGYSHIYSLFAITAFIYFVTAYFKRRHFSHFFLACLFFGLVLLIRPVNILIILFVPFLAGSQSNLYEGLLLLFRHPFRLLSGVFLIFIVFFIQCFLWYLQTGHFLIYTYPGETFDFLHPHFTEILFSYKKGLFVYTPVLFVALSGIFYLACKRRFYLALTWLGFFILITWIFSSWWSWSYGASYGLRTYIDYYTVFFIPFAIMLNEIPGVVRSVVIMVSLFTIPLNIIQTYQYKFFLLTWGDMNKEKYWKIFLKTDRRYEGLLWKKIYDYSRFRTVKEISAGDINVTGNLFRVVERISSDEIPGFENVSMIQVLVGNDFQEKNDARILLAISETNGNHTYFWDARYLIQFADKDLNRWQTGLYNYVFTPVTDKNDIIIELAVISDKYEGVLKNVKMKFMSPVKK